MGKFDELTSFIPLLKDDTYGNFVFKNASTQAYQIVWSFVDYSENVTGFEYALYRFCDEHPEYEHTHYQQTLKQHGLLASEKIISEADVSTADAKLVIALLMYVVRAERFCSGTLLHFCKEGIIVRWLERLAAL